MNAPGDTSGQTLAVVTASAGLPAAVRGTMTAGRFYDAGNLARHDQVVVLGDQAAQLLGISRVESAPRSSSRASRTRSSASSAASSGSGACPPPSSSRPPPARTASACETSASYWSTPRSGRPSRWRARHRSRWRPGTRTRSPSWRHPTCPRHATASRTTSTASSSSSAWSRWWWVPSASPTSPW
ncbi:hypothetical protein NKH18_27230 [Streptomyces sp. M10(2022)]